MCAVLVVVVVAVIVVAFIVIIIVLITLVGSLIIDAMELRRDCSLCCIKRLYWKQIDGLIT